MIKLLLVEDDASLRYIVQGGLEDMIGGYEVIAAANGEEGLKQILKIRVVKAMLLSMLAKRFQLLQVMNI